MGYVLLLIILIGLGYIVIRFFVTRKHPLTQGKGKPGMETVGLTGECPYCSEYLTTPPPIFVAGRFVQTESIICSRCQKRIRIIGALFQPVAQELNTSFTFDGSVDDETPYTRILQTITIASIDVKTTGRDPGKDRIVELSAVLYRSGDELDVFHSLVHPEQTHPHSEKQPFRIANEVITPRPAIETLHEFIHFCNRADIVIAYHLLSYDFLKFACHEHHASLFPKKRVFDVSMYARSVITGCSNYLLPTVKDYLGLERDPNHRANGDAVDCMQVFIHCLLQDGSDFYRHLLINDLLNTETQTRQ